MNNAEALVASEKKETFTEFLYEKKSLSINAKKDNKSAS